MWLKKFVVNVRVTDAEFEGVETPDDSGDCFCRVRVEGVSKYTSSARLSERVTWEESLCFIFDERPEGDIDFVLVSSPSNEIIGVMRQRLDDPSLLSGQTKRPFYECSDNRPILNKMQSRSFGLDESVRAGLIGFSVLLNEIQPDEENLITIFDYSHACRVNVKRASDLLVGDIYSSDPFCVVSWGKQSFKTSTRWNTLSPEWNEFCVFLFNRNRGYNEVIKFVMMDYDILNKNDLLGMGFLRSDNFVEMALKEPIEVEVPLFQNVHDLDLNTDKILVNY